MRIDPQPFVSLSTTTDRDHNCSDYEIPLPEYLKYTDSFLPPGWDDSFKKINGFGIICAEKPEPDCVIVDAVILSARQMLTQVRQDPWHFAYADRESTRSRRYTDVYQPFHFYH